MLLNRQLFCIPLPKHKRLDKAQPLATTGGLWELHSDQQEKEPQKQLVLPQPHQRLRRQA